MKSYIETLFRWAAPKAGGLPKLANFKTTVATNFKTTVETGKLILQDAQPLIERTPAAPPPKWWSKDTRVAKTTEEIELMIREAVKAAPGCESFVGVVIERVTPKSRLDATWEIRGIRFGGMDRQIAREALIPIVERMQREFRLTER